MGDAYEQLERYAAAMEEIVCDLLNGVLAGAAAAELEELREALAVCQWGEWLLEQNRYQRHAQLHALRAPASNSNATLPARSVGSA